MTDRLIVSHCMQKMLHTLSSHKLVSLQRCQPLCVSSCMFELRAGAISIAIHGSIACLLKRSICI